MPDELKRKDADNIKKKKKLRELLEKCELPEIDFREDIPNLLKERIEHMLEPVWFFVIYIYIYYMYIY